MATKSVLSPMSKRVGYQLSFYRFRERLRSACEARGVGYRVVNEMYTSKTCSGCGSYQGDLGGRKVYECASCGQVMDRDVNGGRCIYYKCLG